MKVGLNLVFSNPGHVTDQELWQEQLAQADQAEPLGFDSVWGVEHHFTGLHHLSGRAAVPHVDRRPHRGDRARLASGRAALA